MSAGRARGAHGALPGGLAVQAALAVLAMAALVATGLQAPRFVGALGDYASRRAAYGAGLREIEAARAASNDQTLARQADAAREAYATSASAYLTATERDAALGRIDAAAHDAEVVLHREPLGVGTGEAEWPCVAHRYQLAAHGEFDALLRFLTAIAEDAPPAITLSDLRAGPDPSDPTDSRSMLQVTLTAYTLAETDEPARPAPRAVQEAAQAGQE